MATIGYGGTEIPLTIPGRCFSVIAALAGIICMCKYNNTPKKSVTTILLALPIPIVATAWQRIYLTDMKKLF